VHVEVLVRVQVVAGEAGGAERLDLRRDLGPQLRPCRRGGRERQAHACHVVAEAPVRPHQRRDALRRQHGRAVRQREVQADGEARVAPRDRHGVRRRPLAYHQAGGGEHALAVRPLDRLVDSGERPKSSA
jgi:hypothetical protein